MDSSSLVSVVATEEASAHWSLRCVGSCTAHLEEITDPSDLVQGVGTEVARQKEVHH